MRPRFALLLLVILTATPSAFCASDSVPAPHIKLLRAPNASTADLLIEGKNISLQKGDHSGSWTLLEIVRGTPSTSAAYAILEDFTRVDGDLLFVDAHGVLVNLPKSAESTSADPTKLYLGHTPKELLNSAQDLLANQILAQPGDPQYEQVASVFEPLRKIPTYSFLGTPDTMDKVGFAYGGRSPNFDPAPYYPPINKIREQGQVFDGLVGGYLPVLRFVYPESADKWTELLAFAPFRISEGNDRVQPVWYRLCHVENGQLQWAKYVDSYHPFPPRTDYDPQLFYRDLLRLSATWEKILQPAMQINIPDERLSNLSRFSLIRDRMTRVGDFPKYGAVDKDYAGSEHDGFPDTFNVDTTAMLEWGLLDLAGNYIDNYFGKFIRADGSLLYRGPEIGQYGRMLTVLAEYANYGGNPQILLKHRSRIDSVTKLLLHLRAQAKKLPTASPAYGMLAGWSEADASLDPEPQRYMQPYFSNSTEAARGFRDLGQVWEKIGRQQKDPSLTAWGQRLQKEAAQLRSDTATAISRSILTIDGEKILPSIAGVQEPFHIVVPRDTTDPQFRSYRAYMEMLYSGSLTAEQVRLIANYRANHHDVILGVPTAYGYRTADIAGFLAYGTGYGLIQHDQIREALLLLYSTMAHQYTRGTWTAPETRNLLMEGTAAPYCTPAQLVVPLLTRWLLVFEDPESATLWLGKAVPRDWLANGKTTSATNVPTRFGRVGYSVTSHLDSGTITANIQLPANFYATTKLRLRTPGATRINSVILNGQSWSQFSPEDESITIPAQTSRTLKIIVKYR